MPTANHLLPGYTAQQFSLARAGLSKYADRPNQKSKALGTLRSASVCILSKALYVVEIPLRIIEYVALNAINLVGAIFSKRCRQNLRHHANTFFVRKVNQESLIPVLTQYLNIKNSTSTYKIKGLCHGLTLLYGYYSFLGKENEFYRRMKTCIAANPKKVQSAKGKPFHQWRKGVQELERMCNDVLFLQNQQSNELIHLSKDESLKFGSDHPEIKNLKSVLQFISAFHYDEKTQFYNSLFKALHLILSTDEKNPKFLTISTSDHIIGIFYKNKKMYCYDSNSSEPPLPYEKGKNLEYSLFLITKYLAQVHPDSSTKSIVLEFNVLSNTQALNAFHQCRHKLDQDYLNLKTRNGDYDPKVLIMAAVDGHANIVTNLIEKGMNPNCEISKGITPLLVAAENGHTKTVNILLEKGADVHKASSRGNTPLSLAAQYGRTEIVQQILKNGGDVHKANYHGQFPLDIASRYGHAATVEALLKHGADINRAGPKGFTPLHFAAYNGDIRTIKILLKHGADTSCKLDELGLTPSEVAGEKGHTEIVKLLQAKA